MYLLVFRMNWVKYPNITVKWRSSSHFWSDLSSTCILSVYKQLRLRQDWHCTCSSESSLLTNVINVKISCAGSTYDFFLHTKTLVVVLSGMPNENPQHMFYHVK